MSRPDAQAAAADAVVPTATRDLDGLRFLVHRRAAVSDAVALTFDDGPVPRTEEAVEILDAQGAKGTFFFVGEKVRGREHVLERVLDGGHEIGNHSFHHVYHSSFADIASASAQLRALTDLAPRFYRPPFGAIDRPTALAVRDAGMVPVTWDVDSEDVFPMWEGLPPEQVHRNVIDRARPGSIVLLHDGSLWSRAVEALPAIVATLHERGLRLVTVSELLRGAGEPGSSVVKPRGPAKPERPWSPLSRRRREGGRRRRGRRDRADGAEPERAAAAGHAGWAERISALKPREVIALLERSLASGEVDLEANENLGRAIAARVATNPTAFTRLAERLAALGPAHLRWTLAGLSGVITREHAVEWSGVLTLIEATLTEEETASAPLEWARREASTLLGQALAARTVPPDMRARVWKSLERLSWNGTQPGETARAGGEEVRGHAMHAVVHYALWVKQTAPQDDEAARLARESLEAHLDPDREASEGVRVVYGSQLGHLYDLDPAWLGRCLGAILPKDRGQSSMHRAAWTGHVLWGTPRGDVLSLLEDEYRAAVDALPAPDELRRGDHGDPGRVLARHVADLLWMGALDLAEGGVARLFVERAAPDELAYLVKFIGLGTERDELTVDEAVSSRLSALWDVILVEALTRSRGDAREILAPFGTWYAGGALDARWLDARLRDLLVDGSLVEPGFRVLERLAVRAREAPRTAVELAALYVELATDWDLRATRESLGAVIHGGLVSADDEAVRAARELESALERRSSAAPAPSRPGDVRESLLRP